MREQKNGPQIKENSKVSPTPNKPCAEELSAFSFDRDKNSFYSATDESVDEILDADGYHVVHANRDLKKDGKN